MSAAGTKKLLEVYRQKSPTPRFLTGRFQTPERNFHNSETVEIDIVRDDEDVAVAIKDLKTGNRENTANAYTNKEFKPVIFSEELSIGSFQLLSRTPGNDPFQDPGYMSQLVGHISDGMAKLQNKIFRSIEWMAAQTLQTAEVDLPDANGNTIFEIDYSGKVAHFPQTAASWSGSSADPEADLLALATVIRKNGKVKVNRVTMGVTAFSNFVNNDKIQALLDNRRLQLGGISPSQPDIQDGTYQGRIAIGDYNLEIWTYDAYYVTPAGVTTSYIGEDLVIMDSTSSRYDLTYGNIPRIAPVDPRVQSILPSRISDSRNNLDILPYAWFTENGKALTIEAACRPLTIPTAIDSFGCLNTVQP